MVGLGVGAGWWLANRVTSERFAIQAHIIAQKDAQIAERDRQIGRYRVALGIDKASEGALIELSYSELRAKAATTSAKLRALSGSYGRRGREIAKRRQSKEITPKAAAEASTALMREVSYEFQRTLRADAINLDTELRRRLGPKVVGSIVGLPPTFYSDGSPIGLFGLLSSVGSGMDAPFLNVLANGIDQMAQLLPDDPGK